MPGEAWCRDGRASSGNAISGTAEDDIREGFFLCVHNAGRCVVGVHRFQRRRGFLRLVRGGDVGRRGAVLGVAAWAESDARPTYVQAGRWLETGKLASEMLAMSLLAIGIAGVGAFATLLMAARNVSDGTLGGRPSNIGRAAYHLTRGSYTLSGGCRS